MSTKQRPAEIWYSPQLMEPFEGLVPLPPREPAAQEPAAHEQAAARAARPWVPIASAHDVLQGAASRSGDAVLGLRAGTRLGPGEVGILEYAMHTAATVRDALEVAGRYIRLLNHALEIRVEAHGDAHGDSPAEARVLVRLHSRVVLPPIAEDFMLCAFYRAHVLRLLRQPQQVECRLMHAAPASDAHRAEYEKAFAPAQLAFSAPCSGFSLPRAELDTPLPKADARLHAILLDSMNRALREQSVAPTFTDRVRALLVQKLHTPRVSSAHIARALKLSERTLARRLAAEGTSFAGLLDDVRRVHAVKALDETQLHIDELAYQLGFSQATAFYRAFKRWTGQTPQQYRTSRRSRGR